MELNYRLLQFPTSSVSGVLVFSSNSFAKVGIKWIDDSLMSLLSLKNGQVTPFRRGLLYIHMIQRSSLSLHMLKGNKFLPYRLKVQILIVVSMIAS